MLWAHSSETFKANTYSGYLKLLLEQIKLEKCIYMSNFVISRPLWLMNCPSFDDQNT